MYGFGTPTIILFEAALYHYVYYNMIGFIINALAQVILL